MQLEHVRAQQAYKGQTVLFDLDSFPQLWLTVGNGVERSGKSGQSEKAAL